MNQRRGFLGAAAAFVAGLFGARPVRAAASAWPEDRVRVFRWQYAFTPVDGGRDMRYDGHKWIECQPQDVKKGDWLMRIGVSEKNGDLWQCDTWQAGDDWQPCPDGTKHGQNCPVRGSMSDLLETATVRARMGKAVELMDQAAGTL